MHRLCSVALCAALIGCGDNFPIDGPDAPPSVDAGPPASPVADAAPPDAWLAPPDAPEGEVCDYLPGTFNEEIMANYPVRFGKGQGLEISPDIRQTGLLELENAHVGNRDVIEKRRGAVQLGDSRSTTPGDDVPDDDRRAIWARGDEVILETHDAIYREQKAITTFAWSRAASWVRMRLREMYANTFSTTIVSSDAAVLGDATLVAYQLTGATGTSFAIYSGMARELLQDFAISERPRLTHEGDRVRLTFRNTATNTLDSGTYSAGAGSIAVVATVAAVTAGVRWDVNSQQLDTGNRVTVFAKQDTAATTITVNIVADSRSTSHVVNTGFTSLTDVSVSIWPLVRSNSIRYTIAYSGVSGGAPRAEMRVFDLPVSAGAVVQASLLASVLTGTGSVSVASSWESVDKVWMAVEETSATGNFVSYWRGDASVAIGFNTAGAVHRSASLVGQGVIAAGTPVNTGATDLLSPAFLEQPVGASVVARSGWLMFAPRTSEFIARSFFGFTGDATTRAARPAKGSVSISGDTITWAGPAAVPSEPGTTLRAIAVCKLDRSARANKVAVLDETAISAHAGYPRAYDGTSAFEHDWHILPGILSVNTGLPGGTTTAGAHGIAVTFEADDANGLRYRSAPTFLGGSGTVTSGGVVGNSMIGVQIEPMSHTERSNVRAVVWMTEAGLPLFKRAAEAAVTGSIQTINVDIQDTNLSDNEVLDQGPGSSGEGILPSEPARVTDFVSLLIDRLASRDPRVGSLMTFTIPSREASGFSAHWSSSNVIQESLERDITSAIELNGRIFMASESGFSELQGDGPDATGNGTFGTPLTRFVPIGIEDHSITERTPLGYAFGSINGPRLMSLAGTVEHIEEAVERQYEINGGHTVAIAFDENREEIVFLDDSAQTLRLNTHNGRWASDSNRLGRDITVTRSGDLYLLRSDGKVLRQSEDVYADGASGYSTTIAFRLRAPSRDGVAHGGFNFNGLELFGEYLGSHAITVTVTLDFRDSSVILQGEVPAARVVQNAADGRDYRYAFYGDAKYCYAARCEVTLSSTTGQTARIDGIDVRYNVATSGDPAQVQEEQRFSLDVIES